MEKGKIVQNPVREIENYHKNAVCYKNQKINGDCQFKGINGRVLDMTVEIVSGDFREFTISFAQNERYHTDFSIVKHKNIIEIDRTYSGMVRDAIAIRKSRIKSSVEKCKIRLLLDKNSAEVFLMMESKCLAQLFIHRWKQMEFVLRVMEVLWRILKNMKL